MTNSPKRGEIWLVNLEPTIGAEIQKTRPTIIISSDVIGKLPLKLIVPITDWKDYFASNLWHIYLEPSPENGLAKPSTADVLQLRSVDIRRFTRRLGIVSPTILQEITEAIAALPTEDYALFQEALMAKMVRKTPGVCGGNACIRDTRIAVWTVISLGTQGADDEELLLDFQALTDFDVLAARAYYQLNREEINNLIASHERGDG